MIGANEKGTSRVKGEDSSAEGIATPKQKKLMDNPEWRTRYWDDSEVTQLLSLWGDKSVQRELDGTRRDNQVFIKLSEDLRRRGILRSPAQVREKIKILKREYRLCLGRGGAGISSASPSAPSSSGKNIPAGKFKYFDQMKDILGSPAAGRSPTGHSVSSPNETSNDNASACASNYLEYLQNYDKTGTTHESVSYEPKPLDLHVSSEAVNNLLRGISPKEVDSTANRMAGGRVTYGKRTYADMAPASDTSDSETSSKKRWRHYGKVNDGYLVQDILDRIFNYFRESDERFFGLEERRMRHEKELELLRQEREARVLDTVCQMTSEMRKHCCVCQCDRSTRVPNDQYRPNTSKEPTTDSTQAANVK